MQIKQLHPGFIMPIKSTDGAGAWDIYMPTDGVVTDSVSTLYPLGFSLAVPKGYMAMIQPRSGVGSNFGLEMVNTQGWIDSDYRGEWKAMLKTKFFRGYSWKAGDRILQFAIVAVLDDSLQLVDELDTTQRGTGGFGSTGQ